MLHRTASSLLKTPSFGVGSTAVFWLSYNPSDTFSSVWFMESSFLGFYPQFCSIFTVHTLSGLSTTWGDNSQIIVFSLNFSPEHLSYIRIQ